MCNDFSVSFAFLFLFCFGFHKFPPSTPSSDTFTEAMEVAESKGIAEEEVYACMELHDFCDINECFNDFIFHNNFERFFF